MPFRPTTQTQLTLAGAEYRFSEHPAAPGMPYGQTGRRATVYQVQDIYGRFFAFKVFQRAFQTDQVLRNAAALQPYASLPGLQVCYRKIITRTEQPELISRHPDLEYAALMPWVPGQTWQDILLARQPLEPSQSLFLARSLAATLAGMEARGLAHCDLSGANLLISSQGAGLALVDVEEMYAPGFERPSKLPAGSLGYAHQSASQGLWSAEADRFAGAVLMAEILCWCDSSIHAVASAEQYFEGPEMQSDCLRSQTLLGALDRIFGGAVAGLLKRAWFAPSLQACPSFKEWMGVLDQASQRAPALKPAPVQAVQAVSAPRPAPVPESGPPVQRPVARAENYPMPPQQAESSGSKSLVWLGGAAAVLVCLGLFAFLGVGGFFLAQGPSASTGYSPPAYENPTDTSAEVWPSDQQSEPTARPATRTPRPQTASSNTPRPQVAPTSTRRPTTTPSPDSCPGAPVQRLRVGGKAYVCTKRDSVIMREGPARSYAEQRRLVPGADLKIIGGPSCANNWSWWEVETESGYTGWMAEGGDATDPYFLCPND